MKTIRLAFELGQRIRGTWPIIVVGYCIYWILSVPLARAEETLQTQTPSTPSALTEYTTVINPCTAQETWSFAKDFEQHPEFQLFLSGVHSPIRGFAEALSSRRLAVNTAEQSFAEYWLARALLNSGLANLAQKGFLSLVLDREISAQTSPYQLAALGCLSSLRKKFGSIPVGEIKEQLFLSQLSKLKKEADKNARVPKRYLAEIALAFALDRPQSRIKAVLPLVGDFKAFEGLLLGTSSSLEGSHSNTIHAMETFFANFQKDSDFFKPYLNQAHLLYARALYASTRYKDAVEQYKQVGARSNDWVHALSEQAWAHFMSGQYREAIGVGIGLQSGGLKHTFAPEAMMVTAMALNEMCRFPESMNVIQSFRKNYHDSYFWLKNESVQTGDKTSSGSKDQTRNYKQVIAFAKKAPDFKVPSAIASEWIRSPIFISNQEKINLIFKERSLAEQLGIQGRNEQKATAIKLLSDVRKLRKQFKLAKIKLGTGEKIPQTLVAALDDVRTRMTHYRRLKAAGPIWRTVLARHLPYLNAGQTVAMETISREIASLNKRMYVQLDEISENNEFIEVEILNGASEDIIWQNAHPGYKDQVKNSGKSGRAAAAEKVWDWGKTRSGFDGRGEIWEDEVGSLAADLYDNCENKDKYASVGSFKKAD